MHDFRGVRPESYLLDVEWKCRVCHLFPGQHAYLVVRPASSAATAAASSSSSGAAVDAKLFEPKRRRASKPGKITRSQPARKKRRNAESGNPCVSCHEFFGTADQKDECSKCFISHYGHLPEFAQHPLLLQQVRTDYDFRQIDQLFDAFCTITEKKVAILKHAEAAQFIRQYGGAQPLEMLEAFHGQLDFPACIMRSSDADELLKAVAERQLNTQQWRFDHVIGPRVLDRWNLKQRSSVLDCYYLQFGAMVKPPSKLVQLLEIWRQYWSFPDLSGPDSPR